jgi:hypothetical protein
VDIRKEILYHKIQCVTQYVKDPPAAEDTKTKPITTTDTMACQYNKMMKIYTLECESCLRKRER